MLKHLRNYLSIIFILSFSVLLGAALTGCKSSTQLEAGNGVSVGTLNKPVFNDATVTAWASEAATAVYNYNDNNYQQNLQNASQYFTADGWQTYMAAFTMSRNLAEVIKHKMTVSAVAGGTPVIISQGELAGRYTWKVQMPLLVTYQDAHTQYNQHQTITMLIVRTSAVEGVHGLGIKQFIALSKPQD